MHARARVGAVLIVLLGFAAHAPSLASGFLAQGRTGVDREPGDAELEGVVVPDCASGHAGVLFAAGNLTLGAQFQLTTRPVTFHLLAVAMHVVVALLFWTLLRKLELPGALAAAAVFVAHPINTEAVNWISQRPTLLATGFLLAAAIVYFRRTGLNPPPAERWGMWHLPESRATLYAWAFAFFLAAIAAQPVAAIFPLFRDRDDVVGTPARHARRPRAARPVLRRLDHRARVTTWLSLRAHDTSGDPTLIQRLAIFGRAFWFYLGTLAWPVGLMFAYPRWSVNMTVPTVWLGLAAAGARSRCRGRLIARSAAGRRRRSGSTRCCCCRCA